MEYICMSCGKVYNKKSLPTIGKGDGCCSIGSLIETDHWRRQRIVEYKESKRSLESLLKIIKY